MFHIVEILVFLKVLNVVFGNFYYAQNYPYNGYETLVRGGSSLLNLHDQIDNSAYGKSLLNNQGNSLYSGMGSVNFLNKDNSLRGHDVAHHKTGTAINHSKQVIGQNLESDVSHKRKHVKSGFHNTYSKDESGSNSSFYEDSDDRGEKNVYDKRHGAAGEAQNNNYKQGLRDGHVLDQRDDRYSGFNEQGNHGVRHYGEQDHGNRRGYYNKYDKDLGDRYWMQNERPNDHNYYRSNEIIDRRRPIDNPYPVTGYINDYTHHLSNNLPPPIPLAPPPPLSSSLRWPHTSSTFNRRQENNDDDNDSGGYFSRHKITIYDDPRELPAQAAQRRRETITYNSLVNNVGGVEDEDDEDGNGIYHTPSRLYFRPSPLRLRDFYDTNDRDNLRYYRYRGY